MIPPPDNGIACLDFRYRKFATGTDMEYWLTLASTFMRYCFFSWSPSQMLVRLEFEIKLEPLLLSCPAATAPPAAATPALC